MANASDDDAATSSVRQRPARRQEKAAKVPIDVKDTKDEVVWGKTPAGTGMW